MEEEEGRGRGGGEEDQGRLGGEAQSPAVRMARLSWEPNAPHRPSAQCDVADGNDTKLAWSAWVD